MLSASGKLVDSFLINLYELFDTLFSDQPVLKVNIKKANIFHILHIISIRPIRSANCTDGV